MATLNIAIRADASPTIGFGHVSRCLALANELEKSGCSCLFICKQLPQMLQEKITAANHAFESIRDEDEVGPILQDFDANWLVIDHYGIERSQEVKWQQGNSHLKLLVIDDLANRPHQCDMLLDISPERTKADYKMWVPASTRFCLGTRYALLDQSFLQPHEKAQQKRLAENKSPRKLLITLGGGEVTPALSTVMKALGSLEMAAELQLVIASSTAPTPDMISAFPGKLEHVGYSDKMAELMLEVDLAIGAAGGVHRV